MWTLQKVLALFKGFKGLQQANNIQSSNPRPIMDADYQEYLKNQGTVMHEGVRMTIEEAVEKISKKF